MLIPPNLSARALCALALACLILLGLFQPTQAQAPEQWAVVNTDAAPILRKIENSPDAITHQLWSGTLVTKLPPPATPPTLKLSVDIKGRPPARADGVLDPVRLNITGERAFAFRSMLSAPAVEIPSRAALCSRVAASITLAKDECAEFGVFILGPSASSKSARVAAVLPQESSPGRLVVLDLANAAKPAVTTVNSFEYRGWLPLGNGYSVILGEQYRRAGNLTGFSLTPMVVTPAGMIEPGPSVDIKTAEPKEGVTTVVEGTYRIEARAPLHIAIDLQQEVVDIKTGASRSKERRTTEVRWNAKSNRFEVSRGSPPRP